MKFVRAALLFLVLIQICLTKNDHKRPRKHKKEVSNVTDIVESDVSGVNDQFKSKISPLYEQLGEIDEEIRQRLLRLHLIKKIKANKISVPSMVGVEGSSSSFNTSDLSYEDIDKLFANSNSLNGMSVTKNFIERNHFKAGNSTILTHFLMNTPAFNTPESETIVRVACTLFENGTIGIYSVASGSIINLINLPDHFKATGSPQVQNWSDEFVGLTISEYNEMFISIATKSNNIYRINLGIKQLNVTESDSESSQKELEREVEPNKTDSRSERARKQSKRRLNPIRLPKTLDVDHIAYFNLWDVIIDTNATIYQPAVDVAKESHTSIVKVDYYGKLQQGNFIFECSDNKFYIVKQWMSTVNNFNYKVLHIANIGLFDPTPTNQHQLYYTRQKSLSIFASGNKIGFMKAHDGQVAPSFCDIGTDNIIALEHDKQKHGLFYVGIQTGEIIVMRVMTENRNEIGCNFEGKLSSDLVEGGYHIASLNQYLIKYDNHAQFDVYNLTGIDADGGIAEYSKIQHVRYVCEKCLKPQSSPTSLAKNFDIGLFNLQTLTGNDILFKVPGKHNELILIEVLNEVVREELWASMILENKIILFIITIFIVVLYRMCTSKRKSSPGHSKIKNKWMKKNSKKDDKTDQLNEIAQRLQNIGNISEKVGKLKRDTDEGRPKKRHGKLGVDML